MKGTVNVCDYHGNSIATYEGETGYALYCEDSFVTELSSSDEAEAYEEAINYEKQR